MRVCIADDLWCEGGGGTETHSVGVCVGAGDRGRVALRLGDREGVGVGDRGGLGLGVGDRGDKG